MKSFHVQPTLLRRFIGLPFRFSYLLGELLLPNLDLSGEVLCLVAVIFDFRSDEVSQLVDLVVHAGVEEVQLLIELGFGLGEGGADALVDGRLCGSQAYCGAGRH